VLLVLASHPKALLACLSCAAEQRVQEGFFWGLIFMMVSPWMVVGLIGGGLYLAFRRERREAVEELLRAEAAPAAVLEENDVRES
jgi:hypothetical protein